MDTKRLLRGNAYPVSGATDTRRGTLGRSRWRVVSQVHETIRVADHPPLGGPVRLALAAAAWAPFDPEEPWDSAADSCARWLTGRAFQFRENPGLSPRCLNDTESGAPTTSDGVPHGVAAAVECLPVS